MFWLVDQVEPAPHSTSTTLSTPTLSTTPPISKALAEPSVGTASIRHMQSIPTTSPATALMPKTATSLSVGLLPSSPVQTLPTIPPTLLTPSSTNSAGILVPIHTPTAISATFFYILQEDLTTLSRLGSGTVQVESLIL